MGAPVGPSQAKPDWLRVRGAGWCLCNGAETVWRRA
jgi:hypothetical protein